jgi:drug/metabolite transporter (DMT)-like permease
VRLGLLFSCCCFSLSLAVGQLLFKLAADDVKSRLAVSKIDAVLSGWLVSAVLLYACSTVLWLWILSQVSLSKAYPFALMGAALVPLMAYAFLHEHISPTYILGAILVVSGIAIIQVGQ